jgi:hypothetical protein
MLYSLRPEVLVVLAFSEFILFGKVKTKSNLGWMSTPNSASIDRWYFYKTLSVSSIFSDLKCFIFLDETILNIFTK